jgi:hypothetical protein
MPIVNVDAPVLLGEVLMRVANNIQGLLAGAAFGGALLAAASAGAAELSWSYATASVTQCSVGACGTPGGQTVVRQETFSGANMDNNASVYVDDYSPSVTPYNYGMAFSSAEGGEGDLSLPELHAYAQANFVAATNPDSFGLAFATALGVQGFTNSTDNALVIPLDAFEGVVDYQMFGPANGTGVIGASLALTTDAINDPFVATQWFAGNTTPGMAGQFAATCGTTGALALSSSPSVSVNGPTGLSFLTVGASSCIGQNDFLLQPGETFYMWARLTVGRATFGVTDAANTFNIQFSPEASPELQQTLAQSLLVADGSLIAPSMSVPEPTSWAMMILGFGLSGAVVRRRRAAAALA